MHTKIIDYWEQKYGNQGTKHECKRNKASAQEQIQSKTQNKTIDSREQKYRDRERKHESKKEQG
jgi:hypothetical protein